MRDQSRIHLVIALAFVASMAAAPSARAQQFELINSFAGCPAEGCGPGVGDAAHPYGLDSAYGAARQPLITGPDGRLYGTSPVDLRPGELPRSWGTVFRIEPDGSRAILHHFNGQEPGGCGAAGIGFGADGTLYFAGLRCTPDGTGTILTFSDGAVDVVQQFPTPGFQPSYLVATTAGDLYVSGAHHTLQGDSNYRTYRWDGTLTDTGGSYSRMVPARDGQLYAVFEVHVTLPGIHYGRIVRVGDGATVYDFGIATSIVPESLSLVAGSDGHLYGVVAEYGFFSVSARRPFRLTTAGTLTYLTDREVVPFVPLSATPDGTVFGYSRATAEHGTLMQWRAGILSDLHTFDGTDGAEDFSPLARAADGHLYGVRTDGGDHGLGTLYRIRMPSVDMTANGADGPVTVSAGDPLTIAMAFDAASDVVSPSEVYLAVVTPTLQILWATPSGFSLAPAPLYSGPLPSFPSTPLITIPDAAALPPGDYYWIAIVDADSNGAPSGHYVDFVKTTRVSTAPVVPQRR